MYTTSQTKKNDLATAGAGSVSTQRKGISMPAVPVLKKPAAQPDIVNAEAEPQQLTEPAQLKVASSAAVSGNGIVQREIEEDVWNNELVPNVSDAVFAQLTNGDAPKIIKRGTKLAKVVGKTITDIEPGDVAALLAAHDWDQKFQHRTGRTKSTLNDNEIDMSTPESLTANVDLSTPKVNLAVEEMGGDRHSFLHHTYSTYLKGSDRRAAGHHITVENAHLLGILELGDKKTLGHLDKTGLKKPDVNTELGKKGVNGIDNLNFFPKKARQTAKALGLTTSQLPNAKLNTRTTDMAGEDVDERLSLSQYLSFIQKSIKSIAEVPPVYAAKILQTVKVMSEQTELDPAVMFLKVGKGDMKHLTKAVVTMVNKGVTGLTLSDEIKNVFQHYITSEPKLPLKTPVGEAPEWVAEGAQATDRERTSYAVLETRHVDKYYETIIGAMKTYIA